MVTGAAKVSCLVRNHICLVVCYQNAAEKIKKNRAGGRGQNCDLTGLIVATAPSFRRLTVRLDLTTRRC
jgi:hypothetical protein